MPSRFAPSWAREGSPTRVIHYDGVVAEVVKKGPASLAGLSKAADGTRTHDLLHGNRLDNPQKRMVLYRTKTAFRGSSASAAGASSNGSRSLNTGLGSKRPSATASSTSPSTGDTLGRPVEKLIPF